MDFIALPEEQAELLVGAHRERPMRAMALIFGSDPATLLQVSIKYTALLEVLQHSAIFTDPTLHLYLRDASLPGDFVWRPHPNPKRGRDIDFVRSLCVEVWAGVQTQDGLIAGGSGIAGKDSYDAAGVDATTPRRLKAFLDRKLRKLCPYRAAPPWTVSELQKREKTLKAVTSMLVHVSAGALRFKEQGGRLLDPHRGRLDWEYELIDPSDYK